MAIQEKSRPSHLASLYEISKVIGSTFDLQKLLDLIIDIIMKETQAETGSIMLYDDEERVLKIAASRGLKEKIIKETRIKIGEGISGWVAKQKEPLLIDSTTIKQFKKTSRKGLKSSLCLPLVVSEKTIGVINVNRPWDAINFTPDDLQLFSIFAAEASIAIHNAQLYINAEEKIQQLFRFNVINRALNSAFDTRRIINILNESVKELFPFDVYALLLINDPACTLHVYSEKQVPQKTLDAIKDNTCTIIASLTKKPSSVYKQNIKINMIAQNTKNGKLIGPLTSSISAPLISKGKVIGMMNANSLGSVHFNSKDQNTLSVLANQAAVAIENANLYRNLRHTYISTIRALTAAVEAKDPYTRGHSDLVSKYATTIAETMNLSSEMLEAIYIAGILHDIGKIGIPENILCKPGQLTNEEFTIIKTHPDIGMRILEPVDFFWNKAPEETPKATKQAAKNKNKKKIVVAKTHPEISVEILDSINISLEIKAMIRHHHEQYQGRGYPDGLKGEEIPLGARILAVADSFEAMTADRPYRKAFPVNVAVKRLKDSSGTQFDPEIVKIFVKIVDTKILNKPQADFLKTIQEDMQ